MAAFFKRIDTAVMGRKTYEVAMKLGGGNMSSPGMKSYVFSRLLVAGERGEVTIISRSPKQFVEELRKKKGKDIWLMGGGELTREFLRKENKTYLQGLIALRYQRRKGKKTKNR